MSAMRDYVVLDVFTSTSLAGNQLAVFTDAEGLDGDVMQLAARELNLSETVFLLPGDARSDARIRIFTPLVELPFAGHPVLGAAYVVADRLDADSVRLLAGSGVVRVDLKREHGAIVFGEMEQPLPSVSAFKETDRLLQALGVARSELPVEVYVNGPAHVFVMLEDEDEVAELRPDMTALEKLGEVGVSCFAGSGSLYTTRMFGPALGVHEDPATGSAAGPLALHLLRHGLIAAGQEIRIRQGLEIGRPSLLYARVDGSAEQIERIAVGGQAVLVARGSYLLDYVESGFTARSSLP
ncbi:MAG: PhzF family phenazine biosynthesis protein [Solirubrobacteraceae bacterium]